MNSQSDFKILWVDSNLEELSPVISAMGSEQWMIETQSSGLEALEKLKQEKYSVVICDQLLPQMTGVTFLQKVKETSPLSTRILSTGLLASSVIEDAVNEARLFCLISKPLHVEEVKEVIERGVEQFQKASSQSQLMKEVSQQNKKLEELTTGLEKMVEERTQHIEKSKNQVERNLTEMRKLVLFIKNLSGLTVLDDLLPLLRDETKKFHHVGKPILCYPSLDGHLRVLYFRGRDVVEKRTHKSWPKSVRLRVNDIEDRGYLANVFARPFAKTIAVPLARKGMDERLGEVPSVVFIEHDLAEDKIDYFIRFISQRLQPMSIAVDRVILEYQAKFVSYQWEGTFDGIATPIAIIDSEKKLLRSNKKFGEGVRGDICHRIFSASETPCVGCPVEAAVISSEPKSSRVHARGRIYEVSSYPIRLQGDHQVTNVINHYIDITDARKLYSKVVHMEKLAAVGLLAGNIAHELNNPLTGIRSLAQVLLSEFENAPPANENIFEDLKEVEKAAGRSQVIIKNLLEFSNTEAEETISIISLNEIINRTLPMLKTALHRHRSDIDLTDDFNDVRVNGPLVQQVFFNLVNNACQSMKEVGTLEVKTDVYDEKGKSWVRLVVSDSGHGIPHGVMQHIFEPFFTTKEEGQGTGLGLSMSRSVIDRYGGYISVESEIDKGTSFTVCLPRVETE